MDIQSLKEIIKASPDYCELRSQTNRAHVLALLNGDLVQNQESEDSGLSCRLFKSGGWGFASSSLKNEETAKAILSKAEGNASFMANHSGSNKKIDLPGGTHKFH
ncbi:MAG: hypothetical protein NXH75_12600, partial [Halobacteriovoraceae bacterium]|nr:hypothetical protein [Halobacteriovoraceae bacterium]